MKTLLFLNGKKGSQMGIEDGFNYLYESNTISKLKWFYFEAYSKKTSSIKCMDKMLEIANDYSPELIIFFHISKFPINKEFILRLKNIDSKPIITYDEGDMYGGWAKPITPSMKILIKYSDVISVRGLGSFYDTIYKVNKNIVLTPNNNWLHRLTKDLIINPKKKIKIISIGNRINSRLGNLFRLPGAYERERLIKNISSIFKNNFSLYGNGWKGYYADRGPINFNDQPKLCNESWIQLTYEHYPDIPFFFSDRIPIALSSGQIVVTNYKKGYDELFKGTEFIYFYKNVFDAIEILYYLTSLSEEQLYEKSQQAKEWSDKNLNPEIVWANLFNRILNIKNSNGNI